MKFLAVIGDPIEHSKSPIMHNYAIDKFKINARYLRYNLKNADDLKNIFFNLKLYGANITAPFKNKAFEIADIKDKISLDIKNSNILIFKNELLYAYNSDVYGFLESIKEFNNIKSALILGAGSTAKSIIYALKSKNIDFTIANRSIKNDLYFDKEVILYENLDIKKYDIVINTTGCSLSYDLPCDENILIEIFKNSKYAFDVSYGVNSLFLNLAKKFNLKCKDGLDMLLWQGVLSFELFFDTKNKKEFIKKNMQKAINLII